jgi:3-oxoacyl-[acyl-carrier protein] reductase
MLSGKTALITGASRGIGRAIALDMAGQGCDIALNHFEDLEAAREVCDLVQNEGVRCELYECDASDFTATKQMVDKVCEDFSHIDILVNNAGIARDKPIIRMSEADYDDVMDINLKSAFNLSKHCAHLMMKQRFGTIINIASVCGLRGWEWQTNYASSKGGMIALTKSVAKELAPRGITCNAIAPGFIETDMTSRATDEMKKEFCKEIPLRRTGTAKDVATLATFLASEGASYITGEVIKVDGGLCI